MKKTYLILFIFFTCLSLTISARETYRFSLKLSHYTAATPVVYFSFKHCDGGFRGEAPKQFYHYNNLDNGVLEFTFEDFGDQPVMYTIKCEGYKDKLGSFNGGYNVDIVESLQPLCNCDDDYDILDPEGDSKWTPVHLIGHIREKDKKAIKNDIQQLELCANAGSVGAMHALACYYQGKYSDYKVKNKKQAIYWCAKAAQRGCKVCLYYFNELTGN